VGENSPPIRRRILAGMGPLGYRLDHGLNEQAIGRALDVAEQGSPIRILVVPTNEELMIALDTYEVVGQPTA
jgi:acetate kinase